MTALFTPATFRNPIFHNYPIVRFLLDYGHKKSARPGGIALNIIVYNFIINLLLTILSPVH